MTDVTKNSVQENTGWVWVIVAVSCSDCGSEFSVKVQTSKPTDVDIKNVKDAIGGMYCIKTSIYKTEINGHIEFDVG